MFQYTPELVAELLERRFESHDSVDAVDLFADIDTALKLLEASHPAAHTLVTAYANGYSKEELAMALGAEVSCVKAALDLCFDHLSRRLNDDPS